MAIAIFIMALTASILTLSFSLPQAIGVWKSKNAEGVSFMSFWILIAGITFWTIWGSMLFNLTPFNAPVLTKVSSLFAMISNGFSNIFIGFTLSLFYTCSKKVKQERKKTFIIAIWVIVAMSIIVSIISLSLGLKDKNAMTAISIIAGSCATFAFISNIVKSFTTRFTGGLTFGIIALGFSVNITWAIFYVLLMKMNKTDISLYNSLIAPLTLSCIGAFIYVIQSISYFLYHKNKVPYIRPKRIIA